MSNLPAIPDPAPERRPRARASWLVRRLRRWAITLGGTALLLVIAWFALTSAAFFKGVILPRAGKALGATVTVEDASIQPFSRIVLKGLKVQTTGAEPLLQVAEVRARYSLINILRGRIFIEEVHLGSPVLVLSQSADGKSNLDPILTALKPDATQPKPARSSPPPELDIRLVNLTNGTIRISRQDTDGAQELHLSAVNFATSGVANGSNSPVEISAMLKSSMPDGTNSAQVSGGLSAKLQFSLNRALQPDGTRGGLLFNVSGASGRLAELAGLHAALDLDWTPLELKRLALEFTRGPASRHQSLGRIEASGPLDVNKLEGRLSVNVTSIDRHSLNFAGAVAGLDFGSTVLNSTNTIILAKQGKAVTVHGGLNAGAATVARRGHVTPRLDLDAAYHVALDLPAQSARITMLALDARQQGRALLHANLSQPLALSWATNAPVTGGDAALEVGITSLELSDWRAFFGHVVPAGNITVSAQVLARNAGANLEASLGAAVSGLAIVSGTNAFSQLGGTTRLKVRVEDFRRVQLEELKLDATLAREPLLSLLASGTLDLSTQDADLQTDLHAIVPRSIAALGLAQSKVSTGRASFKGRLAQSVVVRNLRPAATQTVTGRLSVTGFNGELGGVKLAAAGASVDVDADLKEGREALVRKLAGSLALGSGPAGSFDLNGKFDLAARSGKAAVKLVDFNQNLAQPFLATRLGGHDLVSGSLSLTADVAFDPKAESTLKGDVRLDRFLLRDRTRKMPDVLLALHGPVDAGFRQPSSNSVIVTVRQFDAALTAGGQPGGSFALSGSFDSQRQLARLGLKLTEVNQNLLRPFLAPALDDKSLVTISLNAAVNAGFDAKGESSLSADVSVTNLRVRDPKGQLPESPLAAQVGIEGTLKNNVADLRQVTLNLSPTMKARNQLRASGTINLANTNAPGAVLTVSSDSLDLTPFFDLLDKPAGTNAAAAKPGPGFFAANPQPVALTWRATKLELDIKQLHLRELVAKDIVATTSVDGGRVTLGGLRFTLNGAPVSAKADLDLGVPGWRYDLELKTGRIPVQPLADTFSTHYRGKAQGELLADIALKGAGTTGASLRSNLAGHATVVFTNANIHIVGPKARKLWMPVATFLGLEELYKSPINWLAADFHAGNGGIHVRQFTVHSPAFTVESTGTIPFYDVVGESPLSQPVEIHLPHSLARRFALLSVLEDKPVTKLPTFVKLTGTLESPDTEINELKATFVGAAGVVGIVPGRAGDILRGAATKAGEITRGAVGVAKDVGKEVGSAVKDIGKGIGTIFGVKPSTNAPANKQTNPPKSGPFDLRPKQH